MEVLVAWYVAAVESAEWRIAPPTILMPGAAGGQIWAYTAGGDVE